MFESTELRALVEMQPSDKVLSVYLDTDISHQPKETVRLVFRERCKRLIEIPDEVDRIARFLDLSFDWNAPGLAIFASGDELWRVIPLPGPVASQVAYSERPYVRPLYDTIDRYADFAVALVDKEVLRILTISWGALEREAVLVGEDLKHHRQDGWYAAGFQRYDDNVALHNIKRAADILEDYVRVNKEQRIMLAGSERVIAQLKDMASRSLLDRVMGELSMAADASVDEILDRSLAVAWQADLTEEQEEVAEAISQAARGSAGVTGVVDTLYALHQGRVRLLLAEETFVVPGHVCQHCGYVWPEEHEACPMCKHKEITATPDVVNVAIHKAMETGAKVNIVRANQELLDAGGMAAILRY